MIIDKIVIVCVIFIGIGLFVLGWFSNEAYKDWNNKKIVAGLWISNSNYSNAVEKAYNLDNSGQWVLINVDKDMDYNECVRVASHECGHELWSKLCQEDDNKLCKEGQELINNYSKGKI